MFSCICYLSHYIKVLSMYYYLKGTVVEQGENYIVLDIGGIGYQVLVMHPEDFPLFELCLVYIVHVVREDEEYFVGFKNLQEKKVFNQLISVKGIGPRTALTALRGISIEEFIACIQFEDVKRLKKLDGIGPKAASQIILDLKGSLSDFGVVSTKTSKKGLNKAQEEASQALKSLGFKVKDIEECFDKINDDTLSTEQYVTQILRMMRK